MISNLSDFGEVKSKLDKETKSVNVTPGRPDFGQMIENQEINENGDIDSGLEDRRQGHSNKDQEVYDYFLNGSAKSKQKVESVAGIEWTELADARREFEKFKKYESVFKN